jgi:hypothetical protein
MPESMKNREMLPVGTRVKPAHAKMSTAIGTVIEHSEYQGGTIVVRWDGEPETRYHYFMPMEIKKVRENA